MVFNSFAFIVFFPLVTLLYFALKHQYRWWLLLLSSIVFYGWFKVEYLLILVFTILVDYFAGLWIEKSKGTKRKWALVVSILANVGVLAYFKYANFILGTANALLLRTGHEGFDLLDILLPIGLSFHTFQAMSYTIEVFRGRVPAERNLFRYALYVMFYPQLVAGPIERPQNVIYQFYEKHKFDYQRAVSGLRLMLWGMFKKVVIADRLGLFVDQVYDNPEHFTGMPIIVATVFFGFQIFCDFSGYTDIGLGAARIMGFDLMKNFDRPYFSKSISEFWRRWHISLSSWFKDYVYIPLGGNRVSPLRRYFNLFIVFMISGLWHGASWNFVIWGALHGVYQIVGLWTHKTQKRIIGLLKNDFLEKCVHAAIVFFLVSVAWVFFRAHHLSQSLYLLKNMFATSSHSLSEMIDIIGVQDIIVLILSVGLMESVHWFQRKHDMGLWFDRQPKWFRWSSYYAVFTAIVLFATYSNTQFIYFQF
ncbi:MBOAT family protein [Marinilongibacter aquaticus]|uniref:MBOAT family O-acyltransferase n=1 Tax=Marinilongibacter aquaticus TaxID=2975157 RepID=UPI0021BD4A74|nr:MBOAT family O-acyltransferase [Marinilongibacter aquaticus]UBM59115.1 MBOAT family protein [Marinilongibacter aquaticus]